MSSDTMSLTDVKNRLSRSFLERELDSLERQRNSDLRSNKNDMKKFKNKYSKLDMLIDSKVNYGSDVRMYDTHFPGFCYRRNGEYRIPLTQNTPPMINFDELHELLFTNGEVDIEKILCLHLLAVHKSETLASPPRDNSAKYRDLSPVERLLERSKKKRVEDNNSLTRMLPTYVLEVESSDNTSGKSKSERTLIRDGRLAARLFINEKIMQLIESVLSALQQSNPRKVDEMIAMASDTELLKKILDKPHIQEFLESLKTQMLISSCESFRLSPPFKAKFSTLSIQTVKGGLENLVKVIRKNILQTPRSTWVDKMHKAQYSAAGSKEVPIETNEVTPNVASNQTKRTSAKYGKKDFIAKNREALANVKRMEYEEDPDMLSTNQRRRSRTSSKEEEFLRSTNFDIFEFKSNKNKKAAISQEKFTVSSSFEETPLNPEQLAEMIKRKVESAYQRDLSNKNISMQAAAASEPAPDVEQVQAEERKEIPIQKQQKSKYAYIKKTTCEACLGKWKEPLPSPKTPQIKRNCIPVLDQDTYREVATESTHRISQIIDKEYNKLRPRQNSRSGSMSSSKSSRSSGRESFAKKYSVDTIELNEMDLAKIRQEIKEKETQKKLEQFLKENSGAK